MYRRAEGFVALVDAVKSLAVARHDFYASIADRHNLPLPKIDCLYHVVTKGPLPTRVLGCLVGLTPSAMTALTDRLVARGLATRRQDPDDRRVTLICATEQGEQIVDESMNILAARFTAFDLELSVIADDLNRLVMAYTGPAEVS